LRPACLVTRPEPGAADTAAAVAALGWEPVLAPALLLRATTAPASARPPGLLLRASARPPVQAVLLTSRAAARALAGRADAPLRGRPVLAVGAGTAAEAARAGATAVAAAAGDAASLLALALARLDPAAGPLLLPVGRGYGAELAAALRAAGFRVIRRVAYEAVPATALPPAAEAALRRGAVRVALFFSPRSAAATTRLLRAAGLEGAATGIVALALSGRVASALAGLPWRGLHAPARPVPDALLALLGPPPGRWPGSGADRGDGRGPAC